MRTQTVAVLVAAAVATGAPLEAQRLEDARVAASAPAVAPPPPRPRSVHDLKPGDLPSTPKQVIGGVLGGAIGMVAGGFAGAGLELAATDGCQGDLCGFLGFILGAAIGEAAGLGAGVYLGGGRRGTMGAVTASLAVGTLGLLGAAVSGGVLLPVVPFAQLVTAIVVDREAAAHKALGKY